MFEEYEDIFPNLRTEIMDQQWTNCHFDFERRNIQVIDNSELALLDFQDLCHGPIGIDRGEPGRGDHRWLNRPETLTVS